MPVKIMRCRQCEWCAIYARLSLRYSTNFDHNLSPFSLRVSFAADCICRQLTLSCALYDLVSGLRHYWLVYKCGLRPRRLLPFSFSSTMPSGKTGKMLSRTWAICGTLSEHSRVWPNNTVCKNLLQSSRSAPCRVSY